MSTTLFIVVVVVITALVFDFTNGFHDSSNPMATSVATGAFTPKRAVFVAAVLNVIGATLSTEVAKTISHGMFNDALIEAAPAMVFAGLAGAILWNLATWLFGLPSSSSHALFGGLIGAVIMAAGLQGVHWGTVVSKIILPALIAPCVAGMASALATWVAYRIARPTDRFSQTIFRNGQRISASMVALAHGTSDGQKTMGVITLVLIAAGYQAPGTPPQWWVVATAGLAHHAHHGQGTGPHRPAAGLRLRDDLDCGHPRLLAPGLRPVDHPHLHRLDPRHRSGTGGEGVMGNLREDGHRLAPRWWAH